MNAKERSSFGPVRAALLLLAAVFVSDLTWSSWVAPAGALANGLMDEPAHLATCGIVLIAGAVLGGRQLSRLFVVAALVGSTAIDLDHVPGFLGSEALASGTARPYGHSLVLLGALLALGLAWHGATGRTVLFGLAVGVSTHFLRDLATGSGVSLLWPLCDGGLQIPYLLYAALLCTAVAAVALRTRSRRAPASLSRC